MLENDLVYFEYGTRNIHGPLMVLSRMVPITDGGHQCTAAIESVEPGPPFPGFRMYISDNNEGLLDWLTRNHCRRSFRPLTEADVAWGKLQDRWG